MSNSMTPSSSTSNPRPTHRRKHSSQSNPSKPNPSPSPSIKLNSANPPLKRLKLSSPELSSEFPQKTDEFITNQQTSFTIQESTQDVISLNDDDHDGNWSTVLNSKTSKGKSKKQQKLIKHQQLHPAEFHFDTRGFKNGRIIQLKDVRDLVLNITADERSQDWMLVKNKSNISKTVVLMIPGITPLTLGVEKPNTNLGMPFSISSQSTHLPAFQSLFSHACPTKAGGDRLRMFSCLSVFLTCQLSAWAKAKRDEERKKNQKTISSSDPTLFLLQEEIMTEQGYPKPNYPIPLTASVRQTQREKHPMNSTQPIPSTRFEEWIQSDGWIQTPWIESPKIESLGKPLKLIGIDCEMCLTENGSELTRCTVVGKDGKPILDELVKPESPIINYLTRFSGMTEKRLQGVQTTLKDVQIKLSSMIDFDTVLVGHSLECDLRALKLLHPWVIDTSVIYQHPKGLPMKPSLKWLAQKWLNKEIQANPPPGSMTLGHDSEEDARTAIELVLKKMEKGTGFGEFVNDVESIFERMSRGTEPKRVAVIDHGGGMNSSKATSSMVCKTDAEVIDGMISHLENHDFLFGRLMDLSHGLGWSKPPTPKLSHDLPTQEESIPTHPICESSIETLYESLSNQIIKLNEALPKGTALIIFTGHDDPREMARLNAMKSKFDQALKNGSTTVSEELRWMSAQERQLIDEVEKCKLGMSFFRVK
ncbi:uncharacterized protein MELLADRAFT_78319 [Melampsora larici-populina 98AG31]|uniref:Exonuclease domain-containing protein n=1 Tax=Melampsora larici-populina (strain 98AG31 / pathotype 3-4-7) TaxID=747676 RepID=F4RSZ6_MELLP|nr:uncharacterized protein MELLADRAFT_78319 [Melampsora larici-populina 98AG31]EGG04416.1 hypothetical protein MELLADRAFT_78319 [Melampsora larici-populina 98AG31]